MTGNTNANTSVPGMTDDGTSGAAGTTVGSEGGNHTGTIGGDMENDFQNGNTGDNGNTGHSDNAGNSGDASNNVDAGTGRSRGGRT